MALGFSPNKCLVLAEDKGRIKTTYLNVFLYDDDLWLKAFLYMLLSLRPFYKLSKINSYTEKA